MKTALKRRNRHLTEGLGELCLKIKLSCDDVNELVSRQIGADPERLNSVLRSGRAPNSTETQKEFK